MLNDIEYEFHYILNCSLYKNTENPNTIQDLFLK